MRICGKIIFYPKTKLNTKLTANLNKQTWLKDRQHKNAAQIRAAKQVSYPYTSIGNAKKKKANR